jgi:hypothetical protein
MRQHCFAGVMICLALTTRALAQTDTWHNVYEPNTSNNNFKFNDTSPFVDTILWTNGNQHINLNVSKVNVHTLTGGFGGKIYAHVVPWFGNGHLSAGYNSNDPAVVDRQIDDMRSRGVDGVIIDWYGDQTFEDQATLVWRDRILARGLGSRFTLGIMIDKGAIGNGDHTVRLNYLIHDYIVATYENTMGNAYLRDGAGHPIIYFFDVQQDFTDIDWGSVRYWASQASGVSDHIFIYEGANGFTVSPQQADGAFAWIDARLSGSPSSYDYLTWWYNQPTNGRLSIGSSYKGFDDWPVHCWGQCPGDHRVVPQHCGKTWLNAFQALREHAAVPAALQLNTWNDYEEGTALEIGIDNCLSSVDISNSGSTVNWGLTWNGDPDATLNTIHHFIVWARVPGTQTMYNCSGALANTAITYNLANCAIPPGSYQIYVQAVGQPFIKNVLSAVPSSVTYTR